MIGKFFVEFIGTFIFLSIIICVGEPIPIAVGLLAAIYLGGKISGGNFNPAVSTMFFLKNTLSLQEYAYYVAAQILGAVCALYFYKYAVKNHFIK